MRLILIRHAETPSNVQRLIDTAPPGPGLTELGFQQAAELPARLLGYEIGAVYTSDYARTRFTAAPLVAALGLDLSIDSRFAEINAGDLEMAPDDGSVARYLGVLEAWRSRSLSVRMPGGQNGHEFLLRYGRAIADVERLGVETAAVFSHGAAMRTWLNTRASGDGLPFERDIENTEVLVLQGSTSDGWRLGPMQHARVGSRVVAGVCPEMAATERLNHDG